MIKQFLIYFLSFVALPFLGYCLHTSLLPSIVVLSPITLIHLYIFFTSFSLMLCCTFFYLQKTEKFKDQLGFLYLLSVVLKIIIFYTVFYGPIFSQESFTNSQSINLLIPMVLTIVLEVYFIYKLLNKFDPIKNE